MGILSLADSSPPRQMVEPLELGGGRQVFWLPDRPTGHAFSGRRVLGPSTGHAPEWHLVAFVPDYSGGSAVESHHLPFRPPRRADEPAVTLYLLSENRPCA
jgi:hypothetical protein